MPLSDEACCYLVAVIVSDLGLSKKFPELPNAPKPLFGKDRLETLTLSDGHKSGSPSEIRLAGQKG